jgi:RNA polymerase sigma-70 factor (ECF subfamily)
MADNAWIDTARIASSSSKDPLCAGEDEIVQLFGELRVPLLRYLHSLGLPACDSEDVAQDAFIELFRHLRAGKPRDNLRAWVYRVSRNLALKRLQQPGRLLDLADDLPDTPDRSANPEQQAVQSQQHRATRAVIAAIPPLDRQCLLLRADGLRYREIAAVLDISLGSVAASLSRTLDRIARAAQLEK